MATLESTAFLALGFGAVNGQDFRTRRDPLGRFTLFLISQLVSGSRVSLTHGRAGPAGVRNCRERARVLQSRCGRIEFIYRIKHVCRTTMPTCFWILVVSSPTCLWWKRGPVGNFFWASATKKWTIIDWKVNVSKPAPIHGEHQSPAQWPHTRIFPGQTKLVLQPRSSTQTYNQEPNNIQTYAKPTFSRSPKPTNDKQPTNQKEWLSAKYTWNAWALAQVWSAPFEEAPGLQC